MNTGSSKGSFRKIKLLHKGLRRTFRIYLPLNHSPNRLKPLIIALHGRGGNGDSMVLLTRNGFNILADKEGFIVAYPDGIELCWNDGRADKVDRAHRENIDDVGFISSVIDTAVNMYGADPGKVFVTGISNGAIMAYRLACELSGRIAAIAPVDGSMPDYFSSGCKPDNPVSVLAINNTHDPLVPYHGGNIHAGITRTFLGRVMSVGDTIDFWVKRNNCSAEPLEEELPDSDPNDGTRVTKKQYRNDHSATEVVLYTIHGGGHTWPGGLQYLPAAIIGKTCRDFSATEVIWSFFRKHSLKLEEAVNE